MSLSTSCVFDTLHQIAQWKYKNALFDHYSVFSSRIWTYSKLAICWPFGLTQRTGSGGVVGGGGGGRGGRREPVESSLCPTSNLTFISRKPGPAFCPVSIYTMKSIDRPEKNFYVLTMTLTHTQIFNLLNLFISLETDKRRPDSGNIRNCSTTRRD